MKKVPYKPLTNYLFLEQKRKLKMVDRIKKSITKFDLEFVDTGFEDPSLSTTPSFVSQN